MIFFIHSPGVGHVVRIRGWWVHNRVLNNGQEIVSKNCGFVIQHQRRWWKLETGIQETNHRRGQQKWPREVKNCWQGRSSRSKLFKWLKKQTLSKFYAVCSNKIRNTYYFIQMLLHYMTFLNYWNRTSKSFIKRNNFISRFASHKTHSTKIF